jgi:hypothetical protein
MMTTLTSPTMISNFKSRPLVLTWALEIHPQVQSNIWAIFFPTICLQSLKCSRSFSHMSLALSVAFDYLFFNRCNCNEVA